MLQAQSGYFFVAVEQTGSCGVQAMPGVEQALPRTQTTQPSVHS